MNQTSAFDFLPHLSNIRGLKDRVSSAAIVSALFSSESNTPYIDKWYGHSWSFTPKEGAAVYGLTKNFKPSPLDHLSENHFLRVPYRRIPFITVNTIEELQHISSITHSKDSSIKVIWRGQNSQYTVQRTNEDSLRLYGEPSVEEPSLIPSAARYNLEFHSVFEPWAAILDCFLMEYLKFKSESKPGDASGIEQQIAIFRSSYQYRLWALATAQHYGLPSVGLDVTPDLDIALMFALHKFETDRDTGLTTINRVSNDSIPILYAMGGFENDLLDDSTIAPSWLQCERPKSQSAYFYTTCWGLAPNKAAERIFMAIKLQNHSTWKLPKKIDELFPPVGEDIFLAFLLSAKSRFQEIAMEANLDRIYYPC